MAISIEAKPGKPIDWHAREVQLTKVIHKVDEQEAEVIIEDINEYMEDVRKNGAKSHLVWDEEKARYNTKGV